MKYLLAMLPLFLLTACLDDEMAYTVEASPVKADIVRVADAPSGTVAFTGTFTELDKDGILDYNVGIIATPVPDLELAIYSQTQDLLTTVVTGTDGTVELSLPVDDLEGVTRLEWAGTYGGKAFRILSNL
ncbi:hypothetical protein [Lewinella sp. IMCC34183]|uniref:hypothetical protein n=1 Tax=Lewinella sp. IMCC34183 TaxID=2248762 RepID=UPI001300AD13|nr:hypothetical protein [Lewinella sp. IMCC34183]